MGHVVLHDFVELTVGTLAADNAVLTPSARIITANEQGFRISKMKYQMTYNGKTDGEGPCLFGFSVDLTADQVRDAISATPTGEADAEAMERTNRKVYPLEQIAIDGDERSRISDTHFRHIRMPWKEIAEGSSLDYWLHCRAALTTGMQLQISAVYVGKWLED